MMLFIYVEISQMRFHFSWHDAYVGSWVLYHSLCALTVCYGEFQLISMCECFEPIPQTVPPTREV